MNDCPKENNVTQCYLSIHFIVFFSRKIHIYNAGSTLSVQDKTSKVSDVLIVELIDIVRKCLNFAALDCKLTYLRPSD